MGPYTKKEALEMRERMRRLVPDAYIKQAYKAHPVPEETMYSVYTPLAWDSCRTTENSEWDPNAEIDYFTQECPGLGGYRIFHKGGDARSWLVMEYEGRSIDLRDAVMSQSAGQFPMLSGNTLEWRYRKKGKTDTLAALILEVKSQNENGQFISQWFVIRPEKGRACVAGVRFSREKALILADGRLKCRK